MTCCLPHLVLPELLCSTLRILLGMCKRDSSRQPLLLRKCPLLLTYADVLKNLFLSTYVPVAAQIPVAVKIPAFDPHKRSDCSVAWSRRWSMKKHHVETKISALLHWLSVLDSQAGLSLSSNSKALASARQTFLTRISTTDCTREPKPGLLPRLATLLS